MRGEKIKNYLDRNNISYNTLTHPLAYSAQMTAHSAHIPGKNLAKTVIIKVNGALTMIVVTANQKVNLQLLKNVFMTSDVELATESDFMNNFPDCELGAMPPFGFLYGMQEVVSEELSKDKEIVFNAGTHTELIRMKFKDFMHLTKPRILNFKLQL